MGKREDGSFVYDYTTRNLSFIRMYKFLKERGIKNNKFFLKLYDQNLLGIDPLDESRLTLELKARILQEISVNKWYYLREVVRIPTPGGPNQFVLHRGNLAALFCRKKNLNVVLLLPRQNYKTTSIIADDTWIYHFGTENTMILYSNKEFADSKLNLKKFKDIVDLLPEYVKDAVLTKGKDTDNETLIWSAKTRNSIKPLPSAKDPNFANKLGRGLTTPIVNFDE